MNEDVAIRRAAASDLQAVARLAGQLVRMHHAADPARFLLVDGVEEGYAHWLARELERAGAVLLVAVRRDQVVGYAYGAL